jgi:hypothetical protein
MCGHLHFRFSVMVFIVIVDCTLLEIDDGTHMQVVCPLFWELGQQYIFDHLDAIKDKDLSDLQSSNTLVTHVSRLAYFVFLAI